MHLHLIFHTPSILQVFLNPLFGFGVFQYDIQNEFVLLGNW